MTFMILYIWQRQTLKSKPLKETKKRNTSDSATSLVKLSELMLKTTILLYSIDLLLMIFLCFFGVLPSVNCLLW